MTEQRTVIAVSRNGDAVESGKTDFARIVSIECSTDIFIALGTDMLDPFQRGMQIEREADEWVIRIYDADREEPVNTIRLDANNHILEGA